MSWDFSSHRGRAEANGLNVHAREWNAETGISLFSNQTSSGAQETVSEGRLCESCKVWMIGDGVYCTSCQNRMRAERAPPLDIPPQASQPTVSRPQPQQQQESSKNERPKCKYFQFTQCAKGDACPFLHEFDSDQPTNVHIPEHLKEKFYEQINMPINPPEERKDSPRTPHSTPVTGVQHQTMQSGQQKPSFSTNYFQTSQQQQQPPPQQQQPSQLAQVSQGHQRQMQRPGQGVMFVQQQQPQQQQQQQQPQPYPQQQQQYQISQSQSMSFHQEQTHRHQMQQQHPHHQHPQHHQQQPQQQQQQHHQWGMQQNNPQSSQVTHMQMYESSRWGGGSNMPPQQKPQRHGQQWYLMHNNDAQIHPLNSADRERDSVPNNRIIMPQGKGISAGPRQRESSAPAQPQRMPPAAHEDPHGYDVGPKSSIPQREVSQLPQAPQMPQPPQQPQQHPKQLQQQPQRQSAAAPVTRQNAAWGAAPPASEEQPQQQEGTGGRMSYASVARKGIASGGSAVAPSQEEKPKHVSQWLEEIRSQTKNSRSSGAHQPQQRPGQASNVIEMLANASGSGQASGNSRGAQVRNAEDIEREVRTHNQQQAPNRGDKQLRKLGGQSRDTRQQRGGKKPSEKTAPPTTYIKTRSGNGNTGGNDRHEAKANDCSLLIQDLNEMIPKLNVK